MSAKTWLGSIAIAWVLAAATVLPAQAQSVEYYHTDALGSIVAVTDSSRRVIERREYEPFGAQLTPALRDGPGYTGHVSDAATGLSYMQQRYYDPSIGRFLSVDPVTANGNTGGNFNRYWYANNNPYKFTDPDGRQSMSYVAQSSNNYVEPNGNHQEIASAQVDAVVDVVKGAIQVFLSQFSDGPGGALAAGPAAMARGVASEARVLKSMGEVKNTEKVVTSQGRSIPDFKNAKQVGEIKDTKRVSDTAQIRSQREHAQATGREHTVVTGTNTKVSAAVEQKSTVIRRDDLGPRK